MLRSRCRREKKDGRILRGARSAVRGGVLDAEKDVFCDFRNTAKNPARARFGDACVVDMPATAETPRTELQELAGEMSGVGTSSR